jgi:hypothetical protein
MPDLRIGSLKRQKGRRGGGDDEIRGQQQHFRTEVGNRMAPWTTGREEGQAVDKVQPAKIVNR